MNRSLCPLAVLLLVCAILAAPAPEPSLPVWDQPLDPDKDCKISRGKDSLTIEMPGIVHDFDLQVNRLNAPRLMRDFEGEFKIQFRSRIDCRASAESSVKGQPSYVSAGFLVVPPDNTYFIRSQYRVGGQGDHANGYFAYLDLGAESGGSYDVGSPEKEKRDYIYQRLERWGNMLEYSVSSDGKTWKRAGGSGEMIGRSSKLKVGLLACSTSTDPSKVCFDEIQIIPPKKRLPWEFTSGWGKPVDPDKDCKIKRDKNSLTIEMPGSDHDYDPIRKRFNAPRLLSDLEGEFDVQVRVRIDYRSSAQSTVKGQPSYVSAGFLMIFPDDLKFPDGVDICTRLEWAVSQQGNKPDAYAVAPFLAEPRRKSPAPEGRESSCYAVMKNWTGTLKRLGNSREWDHRTPEQRMNCIWERGWQKWPLPEKAEYAFLRLHHREGWSCVYISPDGKKWTRLYYLRSLPKKGKLGLGCPLDLARAVQGPLRPA